MGGGHAREATYRFLNAEIGDLQRSLADDARGLDTKAALVAGFAAASVSFLLDQPGGRLWWCAVAAHAASLGLSLVALWPRASVTVVPKQLLDRLRDATASDAARAVADAKAVACREIARRVRVIANIWSIAASALVVGTVLTVWTRVTG